MSKYDRQKRGGSGGRDNQKEPKIPYQKLSSENYVDIAEKVIDNMKKNYEQREILTTSQIRNILAMIQDIHSEILDPENNISDTLPPRIVERINYLKLRFVYEAGRDDKVKNFIEEASILEHWADIGESKEKFIRFSRYLEALVAYRKFVLGRDS